MAKQKKKRTKRYQGDEAIASVSTQPVIHRVKAVDRGRFGQWWFEKKKPIKIAGIAAGVIFFIGWLIFELFRIIL